MPSYKYKCRECKNIQEEIHSYKLITNDIDDYKEKLKCKNCNTLGSMFRVIEAPMYGAYESSTTEQRKQILKKRSHDHFKKEIEDKFHELNRRKY